MYLKILVVLMFLTIKGRSEKNLTNVKEFSIIPIENGYIKWFWLNCQIICDYGYITSGKNVFRCLEERPMCVRTAAFIIGKFGLWNLRFLRNISFDYCYVE